MSKMTESEREERISRALAHADAAAGQDVARFIQEFRAKFFAEQRQESRTRSAVRTVRSLSTTRSAPPPSPIRLATVRTESEMAQDPRYVKNFRALMLRKASAKRIIGGVSVGHSDFPDCVAVGSDERWYCSGTLITPDAILTAGHCNCSKEKAIPTRVFFGSNVKSEGKTVSVWEAIRHSGYKARRRSVSNDMMVLLLEEKVHPKVALPRPLASTQLIDKATEVRLVGFGAEDESGEYGYGTKRQTDVAVASNDCTGTVVGMSDEERYCCIPNLEMVAGQPALMKDTCSGDSGGPLYIADSRSRWFLAGVTSRGIPSQVEGRACGDGGVYPRVDRYREWIESAAGAKLG